MSKGFIDDLSDSLKKLNKTLKKEVILNNENAVLLKDIMTDIVNLTGKVDHFITDFRISKNSKKLDLLMQDQMIHEKVVEKFIPAMIAYSILLRSESEVNSDDE